MIEELSRRRGGGLDGYTHADDGIVWDTYVGEDIVVQFPPVGEETLVAQAAELFSRTLAAGARVPEVIEYDETAPAYLVIERIHGQPLSTVRAEATDQDEFAAVARAGEVLGQIHAADGEGYGDIDGPVFRRGSHRSWRAFAREVVDNALAYTDNGPFAAVVEAAADGFQPTVIPEQPRSSVLHDDFSGDNVIIDPDGRAWGIDLDNALYGDSRFGYVRGRSILVGENPNATRAFRQGYERTRELTLDDELESQYVRLAMIKSAQDGEWCRRNTAIETAAWADGLTEWYRSRFG